MYTCLAPSTLKPSRYFAYFRVEKRKASWEKGKRTEEKKRKEEKRQKRQNIFNLFIQFTHTVNCFIDKIVFRNFLCKPISTFMEPIR